MTSSAMQSQRIARRRAFFARQCERLPGWRWLRFGAWLIGRVDCPRCNGPVLVDLGVVSPSPEFFCQKSGCKWLGPLSALVRALHWPSQRRAA